MTESREHQAAAYFLRRFDDTESVLRKWFPRDVLMPVREGTKHPIFRHSGGRWTWKKLDECRYKVPASMAVDACVLLMDLCVVDVDSESTAIQLEKRFPVLTMVPMEKTVRGRHYWFRRSDEANLYGYYDGHGQRIPSIDFKTRCHSGTGGVIVVAPSTGKKWADGRSLTIDQLVPIPYDLLDAIAKPMHRLERHRLFFEGKKEAEEIETVSLRLMSYFEPFVTPDDTTRMECSDIPVPCTRADFETLMRILCPSARWSIPHSPETWNVAICIGDKLGLTKDIDLYSKLAATKTLWRHDLRVRWPEMLDAIDHEDAYRRGEGPDDDETVFIDVGKLGCIKYAPLFTPDWSDDELSLFGKGGPSSQHRVGDCVVAADAVRRLREGLPHVVVSLLEDLPLVLAGGSVVGLLAQGVIELGNDYDLFVYGLDEVGADDLLQTIRMKYLVGRDWRVIETSNAWSFIEEKKRNSTPTDRAIVIQVILRLHLTPYEVPIGFDLAPTRVAVWKGGDGTFVVKACPSWLEATRRLLIPVEPSDHLFSSATAIRTVKYAGKGFDVMVPGMRKSLATVHKKGVQCSSFFRNLRGIRTLVYVHEKLQGVWPDLEIRTERVPKIIHPLRWSDSYYAEDELKVTNRFYNAIASASWACMQAVKGIFTGRRYTATSILRGGHAPRPQAYAYACGLGSGGKYEFRPLPMTLWRKVGARQPSDFRPEDPRLRNLHANDLEKFEIEMCKSLGIEPRAR